MLQKTLEGEANVTAPRTFQSLLIPL